MPEKIIDSFPLMTEEHSPMTEAVAPMTEAVAPMTDLNPVFCQE